MKTNKTIKHLLSYSYGTFFASSTLLLAMLVIDANIYSATLETIMTFVGAIFVASALTSMALEIWDTENIG
jgi:hypothetical protein